MILKHKEFILYTVFGIGTTIVNFVVYWAMLNTIGHENYLIANIVAWLLSVIYAFITNKIYVFKSPARDFKSVSREAAEFCGARALSLVFEEIGLFLFLDLASVEGFVLNLHIIQVSGEMLIKLMLAVFVITSNYFFSKFIIFKKKEKQQ